MGRSKIGRRSNVAACAVVAIVLLLLSSLSEAANIGIGSGTRVNVPVQSMKALRDKDVVKQQLDYSCGAAALATILRYGFGDEVTERDILVDLFDLLHKDEEALRRKEGFSLLDLQQVAQARGYKAQGFRLAPEYLPKLGGPVIVFIKPRGYRHFAVLRGVKGDRFYLADPARGNIRMPAYRFLDTWLGKTARGLFCDRAASRPAGRPHPAERTRGRLATTGNHDRASNAGRRQPLPPPAGTDPLG